MWGQEWELPDAPFTSIDYITSILTDNPNMVFLTPDRQVLYLYVIGRGLIKVLSDFRFAEDQVVYNYADWLRRSLS